MEFWIFIQHCSAYGDSAKESQGEFLKKIGMKRVW